MKDNETFEFENRQYINPDVSRDEQTAFIDTLRDIQAQNNAQIATETHNLGTDIEHPRGGLNGSEEYWKSLYQTPQTNAAVADMKAVAQQTALNDALTNYQNMLQDRYNQAYRDYQKRAYNHSRKSSSGSGGGSGGGDGSNDTTYKGDTEYRASTGKPFNLSETLKKAVENAKIKISNPDNYTMTKDELRKSVQERTGWPDWFIDAALSSSGM